MVAAGNSRKELDTMKSRIILNRERTAKAQEISIPIHGKGGELGIKAVTGLVGLIETLKDYKSRKDDRGRALLYQQIQKAGHKERG